MGTTAEKLAYLAETKSELKSQIESQLDISFDSDFRTFVDALRLFGNVTLTSIGYEAFRDCTGLTSVTIPDSVTSIDENAFRNCTGLISVIIGNGIVSLGKRAFDGCDSLTSLTIYATTPPSKLLSSLPSGDNYTIYVPTESVDAYKEAWSDVASRIQAIPQE